MITAYAFSIFDECVEVKPLFGRPLARGCGMRRYRNLPRFLICSLIMLMAAGCAATYAPRPLADVNSLGRAQTISQGDIRVTAAVLSAEETEQVFGFPLYKRGIQPVWLKIENKEAEPTWFLPVGLDPDYFSPLEVAYPYHRAFQTAYNRQIDLYFQQQAMGLYIAPGAVRSGFVFTNLDLGTKIFNVDLVGEDNGPKTFTFFITVPGLIADHRHVEFENLYSANQLVSLDEDGLRKALENIPCCPTNADGTEQHAPINIVLIGDGLDLLRVLIRSGWNETAAGTHSASQPEIAADIPNSSRYEAIVPLYYYGRPQDGSFRDDRPTGYGRSVLRLWLSPMRFEGKPVWVGLINREISQLLQLFINQKLDLDEVRTFLLENLWYSQAIARYGFVKGAGPNPVLQPREIAGGIYYLTDGYRLVLWISKKSVPLNEVVAMDWEIPIKR